MKKYLFVALAALVLTGCPSRPPEPQPPPAVVKPESSPQIQPEETPQPLAPEVVPPMPKIQQLDWLGSVQTLISQMLQTDGINPGSVLLLDSVKNNTNGSLPIGKATLALREAMASNQTFALVPEQQLANARKTLGLSEEDSLGSRSKAIGLARILNAQYVLYSDVSGDAKSPVIDMQLLLVQSGEIVWSGHGNIKE